MERARAVAQRLLDLSLVGMAVGCGYEGYQRNAKEDAAAKEKRLAAQSERWRRQRAIASRNEVEKTLQQIAKQYDLSTDDILRRRESLLKLRDETQALSDKVLKRSSEVSLEVKRLKELIRTKEELQQLASSVHQQKRTLAAEVEELKKLAKIKEDLQARSTHTCSAVVAGEDDELQMLSSRVQERNKVLETEIEELMRLVKVKEELQEKAKASDAPVLTHRNDPVLKKDDSVQS